MKESMGGAVAVEVPETGLVQQPATTMPPHPSAVAPAVSASAETVVARFSTTSTEAAPAPTAAATTIIPTTTTTSHPKVVPKAASQKVVRKSWRHGMRKAVRILRRMGVMPTDAVKDLMRYDPAAASAVVAGTAVADKVVVPHSVGQFLKAINTCIAKGQLFAFCLLSEPACRAQQPAIDRAVSDLVAKGVTVIAVVAGADFAQRARLASKEYCSRKLPALGAALDMQAQFGMDVAVASLLPGAYARKDFVPPRLPCFAFGGLHQHSDVAWEANAPVAYVNTADIDTETWALSAAMRVLPLSVPAPLQDVAWVCREQLHQLSCLKAKLQLGGQQQDGEIALSSAGPAAAARAAMAVAEAESKAASAASAASSAAGTEQLPRAYLPASLSHLVPTSVVDFLRRNARATAAGKLLAVIRVSEDAWQKHEASIRAALGAASAGSVWDEPVLLPLSLGSSCGIAPVGSRSLVPAALPALYAGGGGYLAEHWSAEADLLSGQAPAVGLTDMRQVIDLHAMRQRAWLRRHEVPE
eukprot:XP_001695867.1 predicted protein [Chlamydomonas reinhardtii]